MDHCNVHVFLSQRIFENFDLLAMHTHGLNLQNFFQGQRIDARLPGVILAIVSVLGPNTYEENIARDNTRRRELRKGGKEIPTFF